MIKCRDVLFALCELKHRILPERPKYEEGDKVYVAFRHSGSDPVVVKCRIRAVKYWYHKVVYDVFVLENKGWVWFGFKEHVLPDKIKGKCGSFYG
jgi:hypothetical protein